ncbi:P-loop ATPase, Sll1717 family [Streptomyces sp. NPDC048566]|uniref:P-loop ATPase, Sll1717 family n=1 Tax=Streptomyces sp. NPDC048566 TaxID=3365569 RepID=UPI0037158BA2
MSVLEQLHFGREDAERDVRDGLLLRGGFLPTAAYRAAVSGRKMLVIGRKGSGKSAICMRLVAENGHSRGRALVSPDEAAGEEIRRFELQGLPGDSAKALVWRYLFAVHAARHVVAHARAEHDEKKDSVKTLARFLKQNGESPDGDGQELTRGVTTMLNSLSLEAFGVKASVDLNGQPVSEGARASRQLDVLEKGVARAFADLACTPGHPPLLLMVDQLELVWSAEPDSNSMVIGLLLAAKHAASLYGKSVRLLLFLRSDIYDSLSFGEGDKFHGDEVRIVWSEQALREMALARARASVGPLLTEEQLWRDIFPVSVDGEDTAEYLFSRCLPRPRDAIQFLNLCQETAHLTHGRERITEADVRQAGRQFSDWKLKDLGLEYLVSHPFLKHLFPLFQNTGYVVTRTALGGRLATAADTLHRLFPAYGDALTLDGIIDTLYGVGFLGVRRGNDVVFAGRDDLPVQPHESEFHIHLCFRAALGSTTAIDIRRYEAGRAVSRIAQGTINAGVVLNTVTSREDRLDRAVVRSCHSILARVERAVELDQGAQDEIRQQVRRVLDDATRLTEASGRDAENELFGTAHYFTGLAAELRMSGLAGTTGSAGVASFIDEEARRLRRLAGGSFGTSGGSSGS